MWDEQYESLLREHLSLLEPHEELTPDLNLREFGLDSLGIVDLLMSIEAAYGVRLTDEALSMETFETPEVLWKTLTGLQEAAV
jgi:acyl carrier protein